MPSATFRATLDAALVSADPTGPYGELEFIACGENGETITFTLTTWPFGGA